VARGDVKIQKGSPGLFSGVRLFVGGDITYDTKYGIRELKKPCNPLRMVIAKQHKQAGRVSSC
jgi:hypothetical protein